jgi:Niemann-Pick C1 protein
MNSKLRASSLLITFRQNSFIVIVSYGLMLIYVTFSLGHIPSKAGRPTFLIGIIGIVIVAVSVLVGYGATAYLGVKSSMISLEVIPFLILAIGVDNMFILAQAVGRETHKKVEVRIGLAFHECFPSIAVACVTEVVTFAVGISTNIPALKVFCMTAVFAILANFVLQTTAFLACLAWDMKRIKSEDFHYQEVVEPKPSFISAAFSKVFTPIAQNRIVNIVVIVVALSLIAVSPIAFGKLRLGIDQQITVRTDGTLYNVPSIDLVLQRLVNILQLGAAGLHRHEGLPNRR